MTWDVDPERVRMPESWPQAFAPYLRNVDDLAANAKFRDVLREVGAGNPSPADALFASMDWIDDHMTYDHVDASLKASAEHAFGKRRGHKPDRPVTYPFKDVESLKTVR